MLNSLESRLAFWAASDSGKLLSTNASSSIAGCKVIVESLGFVPADNRAATGFIAALKSVRSSLA